MNRNKLGSNKTILLTVAVLATGMFFLPSTLTLFSGQHTFYSGDNVSCRKCHEDIFNEIYNSPTGAPHLSFGQTCIACHRTGRVIMDEPYGGSFRAAGVNITGNYLRNGSDRIPIKAHAAVTLECVFCHDLVVGEITNYTESHGRYYSVANETTLLKGGNEACLGCHSHVRVNITWSRLRGYGINADVLNGSWNLSFSLDQSLVNTTKTSGV